MQQFMKQPQNHKHYNTTVEYKHTWHPIFQKPNEQQIQKGNTTQTWPTQGKNKHNINRK
ncbi:578_t:CDS:2 [Acaulospora morrowiae]|uniref:578_t:CDS:1 n=1 Tax=Acaulospora morrowiae TaxID=94023 RepID=A0A9N9AX62_9GLOM|nr:578_t:CDS:2 [Acaulospora morrowiae]